MSQFRMVSNKYHTQHDAKKRGNSSTHYKQYIGSDCSLRRMKNVGSGHGRLTFESKRKKKREL